MSDSNTANSIAEVIRRHSPIDPDAMWMYLPSLTALALANGLALCLKKGSGHLHPDGRIYYQLPESDTPDRKLPPHSIVGDALSARIPLEIAWAGAA